MTIRQLIASVAVVSSSVGLAMHRLEPKPVSLQAPTAKVARVAQVAKAVKAPKASLVARSKSSRKHLASASRRSQKRIASRTKVSQLSSRRLY